MFENLVIVTFFGIIFIGVLFIEYKHEKEAIKARSPVEENAEQTRLLENSPSYILNKNKSEYSVLIDSFDDKVKTFSDNFAFTNEYLLILKYQMLKYKLDGETICNVIDENNFTKLYYHEYVFFVKHDAGRFRVCIFFHSDLVACMGGFYISGEWDNDMKTIFVELYKKCLQKEMKRTLEYIANLDAANEFYKNN